MAFSEGYWIQDGHLLPIHSGAIELHQTLALFPF